MVSGDLEEDMLGPALRDGGNRENSEWKLYSSLTEFNLKWGEKKGNLKGLKGR